MKVNDDYFIAGATEIGYLAVLGARDHITADALVFQSKVSE